MNLGLRQIITIVLVLSATTIMPARKLLVLPDDQALLTGVAPNGMVYYIVSNPTVKAKADFALVQRTGRLTDQDSASDSVSAAASDALACLKRIAPSSPREYLSRNGVFAGRRGFVEITDDATIFRFEDVDVSDIAVDSTLLLIMDIVDRVNNVGSDFLKKWYVPSDNAVIISGDIDAKAVEQKLRYMSLMIPGGESAERPEYVPDAVGQPSGETAVQTSSGVEVSLVSKRPPRLYMNTVQPEIFEMSVKTLGDIVVNRVRKELKSGNIPVAEVWHEHKCSSTYPYDDVLVIKAEAQGHEKEVMEVMVDAMADLDTWGANLDEYLLAETAYLQSLADEVRAPIKSNADYVDRHINAFLYNSSLASPKERLNFHTSRNLPDTMRLRLFNDVAKALIQPLSDSVWASVSAEPQSVMKVNMSDTLNFPEGGGRMKIRSSRKEPVSGGSIWTFQNGFKVVYRKLDTDRLHYTLALNGGYACVDDLEAGEGAFMSDYPGTCHFSGLKSDDFIRILKKAGISMDFLVNMSNIVVSGSLPEGSLNLLLRALLSVANERTPDPESFGYYKACEYMSLENDRDGVTARMRAIDKILCPDYKLSPYKEVGNISDDFITKAEKLLEDRFSKMNDGVLVIVGNMDVDMLKKTLMSYVGGFRTSGMAFRRPSIHYQPVSGSSTYMVDGGIDNVDIAVSFRMPLTMENYLAANLASLIMEHELRKRMDDKGGFGGLSHACRIYPDERFNVVFSASSSSPVVTLSHLRAAMSGLRDVKLTEWKLKTCKEYLKNRIALEMTTPEYWMHAIAVRYLDGKDLSTDYASKIDAVTPEKVMSIISLMETGSKVEYVISKR